MYVYFKNAYSCVGEIFDGFNFISHFCPCNLLCRKERIARNTKNVTKNLFSMKRITLLFLSFLSLSVAMAQDLNVQGTVLASDDPNPVTGASIAVQGTSNGTISDLDGNFSLKVKSGDVLVVSFIGYKSQEFKVTSAAPIKVTLEPDNMMLEEVVAIGYGTMKKSDLTGAVSSVKAEQLQRSPVSGLDQALQGRAAGVTVNANSGQPGEAATIRIRGIGSAIGGSDPIYVVDGVITDNIAFLSPNDIESTEILKDASATAIYGSRGANGVIIVTTKNGSKGKASISFDAYWGMQNRWRKLNLMGSQDMADTKLRIGTMKNGAEEIAYYQNKGFNEWMSMYNIASSNYFPVVKTGTNPNGFDYSAVETDWQDEVFNSNAFMHNYSLSITGGNDQGNYAVSASYFGQEGTIIGSDYERLTIRANSSYKVKPWLKVGEHISFMTSEGRNAMNNSSSPGASVISAALAMAPWDPTHYAEGSVNAAGEDLSGQIAASSNFKNVTNPFSMVEMSHPQKNTERFVGDVYVEINPIKDLTLRSAVSLDFSLERERNFKDSYEYSAYDQATKNYISSSMSRYSTLMEETTLTYAKSIGRHDFSIMAGQTTEEYNYYQIGGSGASILNPTETNWYLSNATEDRTYTSDNVSRTRRLSFLGRVYYSYANRYMITVNFRADGSSKFPENPWGYFPSTALAWRINEEDFMQDIDNLDQLKLRLGWGRVGNDQVGDNSFSLNMGSSDNVFYGYPFGSTQTLQTGAAVLTLVNKNGRWETNEQWNVGVDFGFWRGKLSGNIDGFIRDTKDALLYVNAPAHVGNMYSITQNVGVIRNQGIEIALEHQNQVGKVHYSIGGNISFIKNELQKLNGGSPIYGDRTKTDLGLPLNTFWGYEYEGIYQSDEEALDHLYSYTASTIGVHAGDAKYKDLNGDGLIDDNDKTNIGNPFPWLTYGLNLGVDFYGFDVQLFFQGVYGNEIFNALRLRTEGAGDECTLSTTMSDVWVGYSDVVRSALEAQGVNWTLLENRDGTIPNPTGSPTNSENSSRFIESGAYMRLKNMQIGYTLPKKITQKAHIERCRFYVSGNNLFTITKYSGYDPEIGSSVDYGNYPQSRTFTFGVNMNF